MNQRIFPSKVLLFGEYTILFGSGALALPIPTFFGRWSFAQGHHESKIHIQTAKQYLLRAYYTDHVSDIDFDLWEREISKGIIFDSNIPIGYGLGSSGSFSAAIFHRYHQKKEQLSIQSLQQTLASIESCFHGSSSGMDPLVSYLNTPILVQENGLELVGDKLTGQQPALYLFNSGRSRSTAELVNTVKEKMGAPSFKRDMQQLKDLNNLVIQDFLAGDHMKFNQSWKELSRFQFNILPFLVPNRIADLWKYGFKKGIYDMKICGAGGGGYFLLNIHDIKEAEQALGKNRLIPIL